jgi:predicted GIY-YIG superfamily endonuclease
MAYIYTLELENNKYYIGMTNNPEIRIGQHHEGTGASWTIKYKPINILNIKPSSGAFDENNTTKELMIKYGIDNVRGGTYCTEYIDKTQKELLQKELWSVANCCIRCGYKDHYINQCRKRIDANGQKITLKSIVKKTPKPNTTCNITTNITTNIDNIIPVKSKNCKVCGRNNHKSKDCFATSKLTGSPIVKKPCTRCKRLGHKKSVCYATTDINGNILK